MKLEDFKPADGSAKRLVQVKLRKVRKDKWLCACAECGKILSVHYTATRKGLPKFGACTCAQGAKND